MMEFTQGSLLERATRIDIGTGLQLTQSADGLPQLTTDPASFLTQAQGDARYAPLVHTHAAADVTSGTFAIARLGSGAGGAGTFLQGNSTWAAPTFAQIASKPTTIAGYGITDFNALGDARWSLLGHLHSGADITTGTVADARLSTNIGKLNVGNTWSVRQVMTGTSEALRIQATSVDAAMWMSYYNSAGVRRGYIGYSVTASPVMRIVNEEAGDVEIFANLAVRLRALSAGGGVLFGNWSTSGGTISDASLTTNIGKLDTTQTWTAVNNFSTTINLQNDSAISAAKKFFFDGGSDTYIWESAANTFRVVTGGATALTVISTGITAPSATFSLGLTVSAGAVILPTGSISDDALSALVIKGNKGILSEVYSVTSSITETGGAIRVRELNRAGAQSGVQAASPRISFYWAGQVSRQLGMDSGGTLHWWDANGTVHVAAVFGNIVGDAISGTSLSSSGNTVVGGVLSFSGATARILGVAAGLSLRNAANNADTLSVSDAGLVSVPSGPLWTTSSWRRALQLPQGGMLELAGTGRQYGMGNSLGVLYGMTAVGETAGEAPAYWMTVTNTVVNFPGRALLGSSSAAAPLQTQAANGSSHHELVDSSGVAKWNIYLANAGIDWVLHSYNSGTTRIQAYQAGGGWLNGTWKIGSSSAPGTPVGNGLDVMCGAGVTAVQFWDDNNLVTPRFKFTRGGDLIMPAGHIEALDFQLFSDIRLKRDVEIMHGALERVGKLGGYSYRFEHETRRRVGVIAQEVREVLPEAVHVGADGYLSVSYDSLVPLLIEAIKELRAEVRTIREPLN